MRKIAFISTDWNDNPYRRDNNKYGGCSYYRLVKPMELLKSKYDVTFFGADLQKESKGVPLDDFYNQFTKKYDMIVIKQVDNAQAAQALLHWCKQNGTILVQDFDDNMFAVRSDQPAHDAGYKVGGQRKAFAASMMSLVDALIVSTQPLKDFYGKYLKDVFGEDKPIYLFPNYNDIDDWKYPTGEKDPNKIVIGWAGSITHDKDLKEIMKVLGKVVEKYPNVYVEFMGGTLQGTVGYLLEDWTEESKKKFKVIFGTPAIDQYFPKLMSQPWDIGIAPLVDDEFNRGKSHIKWMEYTMMGIPTIASDVYPYSKNIIEGTGLLAKTTDDWETHLDFLILNIGLRISLAMSAFNYIKETQQWEQHEKEYLEIVDDIFLKNGK